MRRIPLMWQPTSAANHGHNDAPGISVERSRPVRQRRVKSLRNLSLSGQKQESLERSAKDKAR
jgi:hypothetical protein